ncbi:hypothetical protein ACEN9Z_21515, partial [Stenotrophomonas geniculata]
SPRHGNVAIQIPGRCGSTGDFFLPPWGATSAPPHPPPAPPPPPPLSVLNAATTLNRSESASR